MKTFRRTRCFGSVLAVVFLALLLGAVPSAAQLTTGTLVGTVQDPSGGSVAGATVTARNLGTNATRTDVTGAEGLFRLTDLQPGTYEVKAEKAGFKTTVTSNVTLHVGETSRVDMLLQVGLVEQKVEVDASAVTVNTEESRITHIVEQTQLEELPLIKRNIYQLPVLEPGTAPSRVSIPTYYNNSSYDLGFVTYGKRIRSTNFLLDGAPNSDNGLGGVPAIAPILDAVQEFQVSTSNMGREYGRNFGAVINVATKSGTNDIHGGVWEFHRNKAMNAGNFFDPVDPLTGEKHGSALIQNQFGGTLGGPIRKDKTFWFLAYEGFRERRGVTRKVQVETPQLRAWVHANLPGTVSDYLFQNFPGPDLVPGDPVYTQDIQGLGSPDYGTAVGQKTNSTTTDQYMLRLDNLFHDGNDRLFVRWSGHYPRTTGVGELTTIGGLGRMLRGFSRPLDGFIGSLAVGETHVFGHNLVNDFRFGWLRNRAFTDAYPENVPQFLLDDFTLGFGSDFFIPINMLDNQADFRDTVILNRGRHAFKFGGQWSKEFEHGAFDALGRGMYEFASLSDFVNNSPYLQAQQLDPTTGQSIVGSPNEYRDFRRTDFSWFVQDDWKIRKNLTLNLGLRHEIFGVIHEANGKQGGIVFNGGTTLLDKFFNIPTFGQLGEMYKPYYKNFAPAIGLAWDPFVNGKMSVRTGFSMNYDRMHNDLLSEPARFSPPYSAFVVAIPDAPFFLGAAIPYTVADVIQYPPTANPGCAGGFIPQGLVGTTATPCILFPYLIDPNLKTPYVEEWNLNIQYQLAPDWLVEVGYAGNEGHRLAFTNDPNRVAGGYPPTGPFTRPDPYLGWASYLSTDTNSNYHGATFQIKKHFSHGYLLQASYTYGKSMDIQDDAFAGDFANAGTGYFGTLDANNRHLDYGRSSFDIRHRIALNAVWNIGKMSKRSAAVRAAFSEWQLNTIISYEAGRPFTVYNDAFVPQADYNADGGGGTQATGYDRPNTPAFGNTIGCSTPKQFADGIFASTAVFPTPDPFSAPANGNLGRNTFCGPDYKEVDLSLSRNFAFKFLGEGGQIQFRAEAFNLTNRSNMFLPVSDLAGDPLSFGKSTQAFNPRELQLGLKIVW